nr:hypothetical protein [Tanacetum cinerariifolium]
KFEIIIHGQRNKKHGSKKNLAQRPFFRDEGSIFHQDTRRKQNWTRNRRTSQKRSSLRLKVCWSVTGCLRKDGQRVESKAMLLPKSRNYFATASEEMFPLPS